MITLTEFLNCLEENVARITHYESAGDGSGGGCDCIGLIIGALRLAGFKWPGTHGSNWAARNALRQEPFKIANAMELRLGDLVFKVRTPGEAGYALPAAYAFSPDQKDYYHVGVVTGVDPLKITHCTDTPGGIKVDTTLGKWTYAGELKYVDNGGQESANVEEPLFRATVFADNGYPVKLRSGPSTSSWELCKVPLGSSVEVLNLLPDWDQIRYNGTVGYMMAKFLREEGPAQNEGGSLADALGYLQKAVDILQRIAQKG